MQATSALSKALVAVLLLQLSSLALAGAPELTSDDFDSTLASKDGMWLLDFYAPWCAHCKKLAPLWDEASGKIAEEGLPVHLAKMDCTVRSHSSICERYGVSGYPSLRVISSAGEKLKDYRGARDVTGILEYAKKLSAPPWRDLKTTKDVKDFIDIQEQAGGAAFILFKPEEPSEGYKELELAFLEAAKKESDVAEMAMAPEFTGDDLGIRIMLDGRTLQEEDGLGGKLAVFREGAGKCLSTAINRTADRVAHWITGHRFIIMPEINAKNYRALGDRGKPLVIVILRGARKKNADGTSTEQSSDGQNLQAMSSVKRPPNAASYEKIPINAEYLAAMKTVAAQSEDDFGFGYLDGKEWEQFVVKYGISTRVLPRLLIMDLSKEYYLPVPVDVKGHTPTMEFLAKVKSGEVQFSRSFETLVRELLDVYKWQMLAGFLVVIFVPIAWMMWSDYADRKRAATYAKTKKD